MSTNATVVQLLSDLISDFESSLSSWKGKPNVLLPSAAQFYRLGLILSDLFGQTEDIGQVYRKLLEKIPQSHLREVLEDLHEAFCKILESFLEQQENASSVTRENTELALKSMQGLYQTNAEFLLETATGNSVSGWSLKKIELLHSVYEKFAQLSGDHDATTTTTTTSTVEEHLLSLMSAFLLEPTLDFEQLLPAINLLQDKPDKYTKSAWEKLVILQSSSNSRQSKQWQDHMIRRFTEPEQQDYLKSMFIIEEEENPLSSNGVNSQTDRAPSDKVPSKRAPAVSQADTIQRLVQQVKTVFPHLGDGYIETALSHYHGDVERTMSALVEAQENPASLPVTLQRLDPKLPGRWKGPTSSQTQAEDEEARRVTQETVRAMERQQEEEARALEVLRVTSVPTHDEYNDDYDDQFDDIDGFMSNDHGLYDDYETVQTYNKMLKQVEEDQAFWVSSYFVWCWCLLWVQWNDCFSHLFICDKTNVAPLG